MTEINIPEIASKIRMLNTSNDWLESLVFDMIRTGQLEQLTRQFNGESLKNLQVPLLAKLLIAEGRNRNLSLEAEDLAQLGAIVESLGQDDLLSWYAGLRVEYSLWRGELGGLIIAATQGNVLKASPNWISLWNHGRIKRILLLGAKMGSGYVESTDVTEMWSDVVATFDAAGISEEIYMTNGLVEAVELFVHPPDNKRKSPTMLRVYQDLKKIGSDRVVLGIFGLAWHDIAAGRLDSALEDLNLLNDISPSALYEKAALLKTFYCEAVSILKGDQDNQAQDKFFGALEEARSAFVGLPGLIIYIASRLLDRGEFQLAEKLINVLGPNSMMLSSLGNYNLQEISLRLSILKHPLTASYEKATNLIDRILSFGMVDFARQRAEVIAKNFEMIGLAEVAERLLSHYGVYPVAADATPDSLDENQTNRSRGLVKIMGEKLLVSYDFESIELNEREMEIFLVVLVSEEDQLNIRTVLERLDNKFTEQDLCESIQKLVEILGLSTNALTLEEDTIRVSIEPEFFVDYHEFRELLSQGREGQRLAIKRYCPLICDKQFLNNQYLNDVRAELRAEFESVKNELRDFGLLRD